LIVVLFSADRDALAHHSFAMYDSTQLVVIHGTVKEFQWTNPHALLWVTGSTDGGSPELWTIELPTSPGNLTRMGWTKHSLAPGDPLTVEINPLRDGSHGGSFKKATLTQTGVVLIAYANDPYGGDASAGGDGSAADGHSGGDGGGETRSTLGATKAACSASGGVAPPQARLPWLLGIALTWLLVSRRRKWTSGGPEDARRMS
jgi:hypothetical protein